MMKERGRTKLTSAVWAKALERGDRLAVELIDDAVDALGAGVASALNLLDVDAVVIGGGLGVRLGRAVRRADPRGDDAPPVQRRKPARRAPGGLGDTGGAIGAALLVKPKASRRPRATASAGS